LHIAVLANDLTIVKLLLKIPNLDIRAKNEEGLMPFQLAAIFNREEEISKLIVPKEHLQE
jgi:ankyrin repeat protein